MEDIKNFKHAIVRQKILDAVRKDLIGPTAVCEELNEIPTSSYITGLLYPADTAVTEDENYFDVEFTEYTGALKAPVRCFGNHLSGKGKSSFQTDNECSGAAILKK